MPIYNYRDKKTKKTVEVIREFSTYETPPTKEEAVNLTEEEYNDADWERVMSGGVRVTHGYGYGSKGNW